MQNFSQKVDEKYFKSIINRYNLYEITNKNQYILKSFKCQNFSVNLYKNGTVHLFGNNIVQEKEFIETLIGKNIYESIGSDEVGTGDVFGPIVVCSAYLGSDDINELKTYNISDSKSLKDTEIIKIAETFISKIKHSVLILDNEKYNKIVKKYNMNAIKAILHNHAILNLKEKIGDINDDKQVILDQFCEPKLYFNYLKDEKKIYRNITFKTKAESYSLSVAIASIFARYVFLTKFEQMELKYNVKLKKGATKDAIECIKSISQTKGNEIFYKIAKTNFKTFEKLNIIL